MKDQELFSQLYSTRNELKEIEAKKIQVIDDANSFLWDEFKKDYEKRVDTDITSFIKTTNGYNPVSILFRLLGLVAIIIAVFLIITRGTGFVIYSICLPLIGVGLIGIIIGHVLKSKGKKKKALKWIANHPDYKELGFANGYCTYQGKGIASYNYKEYNARQTLYYPEIRAVLDKSGDEILQYALKKAEFKAKYDKEYKPYFDKEAGLKENMKEYLKVFPLDDAFLNSDNFMNTIMLIFESVKTVKSFRDAVIYMKKEFINSVPDTLSQKLEGKKTIQQIVTVSKEHFNNVYIPNLLR